MNRRRFVGAVGLSAGGLAGATTRVHTGPVASWQPAAGTWPLARRDLANTAAAPDATLPDDPSLEWRASPVGYVASLVVGPDRVFVAAYPDGSDDGSRATVAGLDRSSGEVHWTANVPGGHLALRDGTLYVGNQDGGDVAALDAASGDERWRAEDLFNNDTSALTVADGTVYSGGGNHFVAVDADSGTPRWEFSQVGTPFPAVAHGSLFLSGGRVNRLRSRRVSDVATGRPPPLDWTSSTFKLGWPVVADGHVIVGEQRREASNPPGVHAFDAATGEVDWRVTDALEVDQYHPVLIGSPAVAGDVCVFHVQQPGPEEVSDVEQEPSGPAVELIACSTADGSIEWRRAFPDARPHPVYWGSLSPWTAVAGDAVLLRTEAGGDASGGAVRAFSLDGERRWAVDFSEAPSAFAPAGERVYVAAGRTVHALE